MKVKQNDTTRQNKERKTKRTDDLEKASGATQKASSPVGKKSGDAEKVKENQAEPEMARLNYGCKRKTNDFYPQVVKSYANTKFHRPPTWHFRFDI